MTFSRIFPAGVPVGATLTAAALTALDQDHANALDKTGDHVTTGHAITFDSGATLTLAGDTQVSGTMEFTGFAAVLGPGELDIGDGTIGNAAALAVTAHSSLVLNALSTVTANGPITLTGASGKVTTSGGGFFELGNSDWVRLKTGHAGATQIVRYDMASLGVLSGFSLNASGLGLTGGATGATQFFPLPALWQGATITTLKLLFTPYTGHSSLPASNISASLRYYTPNLGGTPLLGTLGSPGTYSPVSLADYTNGQYKSLTIPCGSPTIDRGANCYVLSLTDESGSGSVAGNVFNALEVTYSISDTRPA